MVAARLPARPRQARPRAQHQARRTAPDLAGFRPTFVVGVPYVFEKVFNTGRATAEKLGRGASFDRADAHRRPLRRGVPAPAPRHGRPARRSASRPLARSTTCSSTDGSASRARRAGAVRDQRRLAARPPPRPLLLRGAGVDVFEGYGLTETTAAATVTPPLRPAPGTVGRPVPGTAVRHRRRRRGAAARAAIVFSGYWNNARGAPGAVLRRRLARHRRPRRARRGRLSHHHRPQEGHPGHLRRQERLARPSLEDRLRSHPLVGQCMVVGDNRPYIAALVTLDPDGDRSTGWPSARGRPAPPWPSSSEDPELGADIQRAVDDANRAVSRAESIRRSASCRGSSPRRTGMLTPSLKVKRHAVIERVRGGDRRAVRLMRLCLADTPSSIGSRSAPRRGRTRPAPPAGRTCSSPASRSGRQRRNWAVCRNRSPSMWSYATSHDPLGPQRHPGQVLLARPAALRARQPGTLVRGLLGPGRPGVPVGRVHPQRLQLLDQLLAPLAWRRRRRRRRAGGRPSSSYRPSSSDPTIGPLLWKR